MSKLPKNPHITAEMVNSSRVMISSTQAKGILLAVLGSLMSSREYAFKIGSVPMSDLQIARCLAVDEADIAPAFAELLYNEVLEKDCDNAYFYPPFKIQLARSETNRINGLNVGKTKKQTKNKTEQCGSGARGGPQLKAKANTSTKIEDNSFSSPEEFEAFANEISVLANLGREIGEVDRALRQWLQAGITPVVIRTVVNTKQRPAEPIRKLFWFDAAIRDAAIRDAAGRAPG